MKVLHMVAFILLVIGGLNWLLVAFGWNLVYAIFGAGSVISAAIYVLVGLSAIYEAVTHKKNCKLCAAGAMPMK
jgi:uncharacterized membrane protein YuzA (DUF378 family)